MHGGSPVILPGPSMSAGSTAAPVMPVTPSHARPASLNVSSPSPMPLTARGPLSSATTPRSGPLGSTSSASVGTDFVLAASPCTVAATPLDAALESDERRAQALSAQIVRVVQVAAAQTSTLRMSSVLAYHLCTLLSADAVRVISVNPTEGLLRIAPASQVKPPEPRGFVGLCGHAALYREVVNVHNPARDPRFHLIDNYPQNCVVDGGYLARCAGTGPCIRELAATSFMQPTLADPLAMPPSGLTQLSLPPVEAMMAIPVECDATPDCRGKRDVIAIILCIKRPADGINIGGAPEPVTFTMRDCRTAWRVAQLIGNTFRSMAALDRAQALYKDSMAWHSRFASVLKVANTLLSETELDAVVANIVSQVPDLLDADRCTLYFTDRDRQELIVTKGSSHGRPKSLVSWIFGQSNAPELPFPEGKNEIRFGMSKGLAGHVARTGETLNIIEAHADPRFNAQMDKETGYKTRNMLCVPMCDDNKNIIGVIQAINKNPSAPCFDSEDEALLHTFAAQAVLAVHNSMLFGSTKRARQQSDALLEVTKALSSELNIEALLRIIVTKVQKLLNSERCTVFIVDRDNNELYTNEDLSFGMGPALPINHERSSMIRFPMDRGIAGSVATTLATVNIPDAYKDSRFNQQMDKATGFRTRSILCMSIRVPRKTEAIGVIQCMNKRTPTGDWGVFDQGDEKLLAAFCTQAAVAIENSRLFTQTEKALNHALMEKRNNKFYMSVTKNLVASTQLNALIEQLNMQVRMLLKADDCALYLTIPNTREFYLAKEEVDPHHRRFPYGMGIAGSVALSGQTISISTDAYRDSRFHPDIDQRKGKVTHSILCSAIKADNPDGSLAIVGVISVRDEKERGGFESQEERLLKIFCSLAAVSVLNRNKLIQMMDGQDSKEQDRTAADYLQRERGMKIASDDITTYSYNMEDIEMLNTIGAGSYGEVYKANVRGRVVAVKKLHVKSIKAEQVEAFCQEASLMCQLQHPNIVGFVGAVTDPASLCIITEYCNRGSLADLLLNHAVPMTFQQKMQFAYDAAEGMKYLHASNPVILHRDLKSDNLLVTEDWRIKVGDFGLTRFMSAKKAMTQVGTPMWMAPEIIMGKKYTEKADVYAFGIILWELLTRLEPYEDKEPMQIVVQVVNEGLRPMMTREFDHSPLAPLIRDCWAANPDERPSFEIIAERLQSMINKHKTSFLNDLGNPLPTGAPPSAATTVTAAQIVANLAR
jgi:GAF domain-containing protein